MINMNSKNITPVSEKTEEYAQIKRKIPTSSIGEIRRMAKKQLKGKWFRLIPPVFIYVLLFIIPSIIFLLLLVDFTFDSRTDIVSEIDTTTASAADIFHSMITCPSLSADLTPRMILWLTILFYISSVCGSFHISFSDLSLRILRNENFSVGTIFSGFRHFNKAFAAGIEILFRSCCWFMLFLLLNIFSMLICIHFNDSTGIIIAGIIFLSLLSAEIIFLTGYQITYFIAVDDEGKNRIELEIGFESVSESVRLMKGNRFVYCLLHLSFLPWFVLLLLPTGLTGGAIYMLNSAISGTSVFLLISMIIVFGMISLTGSIFLMIYRKTASAVFYSGITGNFRITECR